MNPFTLSLFDSVGDTRPREVQRTWQQLCHKFAHPAIRYEKDGLLFSPARYRFPRRLIVNVIELSLLVLEVDGAWKCEAFGMFGACDHRAPLTIFRNKKSGEDRCPKCKGKGIKISQVQFTGADLVEVVRAAFPGVAFATYSTHSHLNVTHSNPLAEPRFRIVVPLTLPVPVDRFLELWHWAVDSIQTIPMDPQVKDANRIYYTPVKFCDEAPYEWHVEPGAPLEWREVLNVSTQANSTGSDHDAPAGVAAPAVANEVATALRSESQTADSRAGVKTTAGHLDTGGGQGSGPNILPADFTNHDDRNDELGRRIMARGKRNSRGVYDARCIAHGGHGESGLLWNPDNEGGAVKCNAGCTYQDILRAEGLSWHNLPSREQLAVSSGQRCPASQAYAGGIDQQPVSPLPTADCQQPPTSFDGPPIVSAARLHAVYSLLLAHCFGLSDADAEQVQKHWGSPYGESVQWPGTDDQALVKVCSYPSLEQQWAAAARLAQDFDLTGVPGFFYLRGSLPGPYGAQLQAVTAQYTPWRINLPPMRKGGALLSPHSNAGGLIVGIRIHRNVSDAKAIWLMTSKGLPGGAHALAYQRTEEAA